MWRNYLTVGIRALAKNRTYSFITIGGLAIGMAACLMLLLFVRYEFSYDRALPNAANTYQLQSWYQSKTTDDHGEVQMTAYATKAPMLKDFPQIASAVYILSSTPVFLKDGQPLPTKDFAFTDGDALDVLQLPVAKGDRHALTRVNAAAITQEEAKARFGTDDVVGRTFTIITKGQKRDFQVGAVLKDLPKNSSLKFSTIVRVDFPSYMAKEPQFLTCWGCQSGWVFFRTKAGTDPEAIRSRMAAWEKRNIPDEDTGGVHYNAGDEQDWHVVNIRDVHLGTAQSGQMTPGNDRGTIVTFAVIAILILGMAVVNFTNLTTARASLRAREVALRKTLGANRGQLIAQFVGESLIVATAAMLIALAMVELLLPGLADFLDADLTMRYFGADGVLLPVIGLVLAVGVLGGLYPAFYLSRFQPAEVLKANRSAETPGSGRLRTALVVGQFAVSIGLIICTGIVYAQTVYARNFDPGYARGRLIQIDNLSRYQLLDKGEAIAQQVARVDGVDAVGRTTIGVATTNGNNTSFLLPGNAQPINLGNYTVDPGFFRAMGIRLLAGRTFDKARPMDDQTMPFPPSPEAQQALAARGANVVINDYARKRLGFASPQAAIGKTMKAGFIDNQYGFVPVTIIGVVKDSYFRSLHQPLDPIVFMGTNANHTNLVVRYHGDPAAVNARIERVWKGITSEVPYEARFSEDIVQELYEADDARAAIFAGFAGLSVIVGCLGLFGLAAFTAERRTKEIGIRKVLGARTRDIVRLLVWQFSKPVAIANLIAWPVAWWLMHKWLDQFADRIVLGPQWFLGAGLLAILIAAATIIGHAVKVARANPIHALRYE